MVQQSSSRVLAALDARARAFDFPVLDNTNWRFVAGRLRGFRLESRWALVFELFLFQVPARSFCLQYYAYGDLLNGSGGDVGARSVIEEVPDCALWNEEGEWIRVCSSRVVSIGGKRVTTWSPGGSSRDGDILLSHGDDYDERTFARALLRELGTQSLFGASVLIQIPELAGSAELFRLCDWDHPDIAGGELPSASMAITNAVRTLTGELPVLEYGHERDNVICGPWTS